MARVDPPPFKTSAQRMAEINREYRIKMALIFAIGIPASLTLSYLLALAEHPTAYWLWHHVLGVL